jgi:hypothetical protein
MCQIDAPSTHSAMVLSNEKVELFFAFIAGFAFGILHPELVLIVYLTDATMDLVQQSLHLLATRTAQCCILLTFFSPCCRKYVSIPAAVAVSRSALHEACRLLRRISDKVMKYRLTEDTQCLVQPDQLLLTDRCTEVGTIMMFLQVHYYCNQSSRRQVVIHYYSILHTAYVVEPKASKYLRVFLRLAGTCCTRGRGALDPRSWQEATRSLGRIQRHLYLRM